MRHCDTLRRGHRELEIDRFHAIRRARPTLDASTTLTGENGCGTGSLLAALWRA
jgi:hypothetical protein